MHNCTERVDEADAEAAELIRSEAGMALEAEMAFEAVFALEAVLALEVVVLQAVVDAL